MAVRKVVRAVWIAAALGAILLTGAAESRLTSVPLTFLDSETGYALDARGILSRAEGDLTVTPLWSQLSEGEHDLELALPGYQPWRQRLVVTELGPAVRVWLDPLEPPPELVPERLRARSRSEHTLMVGFVVDEQSGKPLPNVRVRCGGRLAAHERFLPLVEVWTNERGFFEASVPCRLPPGAEESEIVLCFDRLGYRSHEQRSVRLWPGGDFTYRIRLAPEEEADSSITEEDETDRRGLTDSFHELLANGLSVFSPSAARELPQTSPGETVRLPRMVRVLSADGTTVQYVTLETYCRRVLPAEWIPSWARYPGGEHALNAGAVAIRTYAVGYINKPKTSTYDLCGTTACQVYGPTTSSVTDAAVAATAGYIMVDQDFSVPVALTEYSAENNALGLPCGDGFTSPEGECLSDPVCAGETRNGHGRGLCQWGSARWATGLKFPGNSTRDASTTNGFARKEWPWILQHYYPSLRLVQSTPLVVGDAVRALTGVNVRACADGGIAGGTLCPVLATASASRAGIVVDGPVQVSTDGGGYTWYKVQWQDVVGWSVENYLERLNRPLLQAVTSADRVTITWPVRPGIKYRVQSKQSLSDPTWADLSPELTPSSTLGSWRDARTSSQRFYRVTIVN